MMMGGLSVLMIYFPTHTFKYIQLNEGFEKRIWSWTIGVNYYDVSSVNYPIFEQAEQETGVVCCPVNGALWEFHSTL